MASVETLVIQKRGKFTPNVVVNTVSGEMKPGSPHLKNGKFIIECIGDELTEKGDEALSRLVRNVLSGYQITEITGKPDGMCFDLEQWLRSRKKDL